jgi:hypothetical protein
VEIDLYEFHHSLNQTDARVLHADIMIHVALLHAECNLLLEELLKTSEHLEYHLRLSILADDAYFVELVLQFSEIRLIG